MSCGLPPSLQLPKVARLPGTRAEVEAIKPKLDQYIGQETWLYQDRQALEGVVKRICNPKVLVLSTHGYFLPDQEAAAADCAFVDRRLALTKEGKALENPLLRCGLLLAGCNRPTTQAATRTASSRAWRLSASIYVAPSWSSSAPCETGRARFATAKAWPACGRPFSSPVPARCWPRSGRSPTSDPPG